MWLPKYGFTATAISLSGAQSWPYSVVLQLMSTAAAGAPLLEQRKRSICTLLNCPPPDVCPANGATFGYHSLESLRFAVLNGRSRPADEPANAPPSTAIAANANRPRLI